MGLYEIKCLFTAKKIVTWVSGIREKSFSAIHPTDGWYPECTLTHKIN